jgi:hypothetical protein
MVLANSEANPLFVLLTKLSATEVFSGCSKGGGAEKQNGKKKRPIRGF